MEGLRNVSPILEVHDVTSAHGLTVCLALLALSNLGRRGYLAFWSSVIARHILSLPARRATSIKSISDETYILPDDVILALKDMDVLETKKRADSTAIVNQARVRKWISTHRVDLEPIVDPRCFLARSIKSASSVKSGAQ